jgi:hypothetical protein
MWNSKLTSSGWIFISCSVIQLIEDIKNKMNFQVAVGAARPSGPVTSGLLITSSLSTHRYLTSSFVAK